MWRNAALCVLAALVAGLAGCGIDEPLGAPDAHLTASDGGADSEAAVPEGGTHGDHADADGAANDVREGEGGSELLQPLTVSKLEGDGAVLDISVRGGLAILGRALSNGPELVVVSLEPPGMASEVGGLHLEGSVNAVVLEGSHAYLATSDDRQELVIVDVSNPAEPTVVGALDASGDADGTALDAAGNRVVLGRARGSQAELSFIDASDPTAPLLRGSADLEGGVTDIEMHKLRAYVTTNDSGAALVAFDYSDLAAVTRSWSLGLPGPAHALDLNESRLYVVGHGEAQSYFAEVEAPAGAEPVVLSSLRLQGTPTDVVAYGRHVAIAAGDVGVLPLERALAPARQAPVLLDPLPSEIGAQSLAFDERIMLVGGARTGAVEIVRADFGPRIVDMNHDGRRVVSILGDSNTGRPGELSWVEDLLGLLIARDWVLVNRGQPYSWITPTRDYPDAWDQLEIALAVDSPDAVVAAFGTNDVSLTITIAEAFGQTLGEADMADIVDDLSRLRERCQREGLLLFIALTPPAFFDDVRTQLIFELNHQLRNSFDPAMLIDFHSTMVQNEDFNDELHVGPSGNAKRALEMSRKLEPAP